MRTATRRMLIPFLAVVAIAALVGLLVYGLASRADNTTIDDAVAHGHHPQAPGATIALPTLDGSATRSLQDLRGQVIVLNFWASWCAPCKDEAPDLEDLQRRLARANAGTVLGVAFRDTSGDAKAFAKKFGLSYPILHDRDGKLAAAYGTRMLPETFVIDPTGRIIAVSRGTVSRPFLDRAISNVLRHRGVG